MHSSNPNEENAQHTVDGVAAGAWSSGLYDCFSDWSVCCLTCWCPCITFGRISEIVDKGATSCWSNGLRFYLSNVIIGGGWNISYKYRSKMRQQFNLEESPCADSSVHHCCLGCALCQEYRELKSHGFDVSVGWKGNVNRGVAMASTAPVVDGGMKR